MIDQIVDRYIKLRDKKAEIKADYEAKVASVEEAMAKLEAMILEHLNATGCASVGCEAGTAFKQTTTSATVADWDATLNFIRENDMWHMLDRRVNKTAVVEYREANDDLPPGVNWREETVVRIRRS